MLRIRHLVLASGLGLAAFAAAGELTTSRQGQLSFTRAQAWIKAGYRGQGVKVAVLDTGFRGYAQSQGTTLPNGIHARSFRIDGNMDARKSRHGVLCGEIVHAFAPEAELLFADWQPDVADSFLAALAWAKKSGAQIVTCSVVMPSWSDGEGGGRVHQAIRKLLDDGVLLIACAGNLAKRHWHGQFNPGVDGWHRWPNGSIDNDVTPWGDDVVSLELSAKSGAYEVVVVDEGGRPVSRATTAEEGVGVAARVTPRYKAKYSVRVRSQSGGKFHITALGSWLHQHVERGSIMFPGDGSEWFTVGAWEAGKRADYSSCGPNSHLHKPDLVAEVPFSSRERVQPFGGTSAAAPQVAGLAALYWSKHPNATVAEVQQALRRAAQDVGLDGVDIESGWGLARLPRPH